MRPLLLALTLAATLNAATTAPKPVTTVDPGPLAALANTGLDESAVVNLLVKADGSVAEVTLKSADHEAFGTAAVTAAQGWKFEPAQRDGQAVDLRVALPFEFKAPPEQRLNAMLHRTVFQNLPQTPLTAAEFGTPPKAKRLASLGFPRALLGSGVDEIVTVRFVIGPEGNTFNPTLEGTPRREFMLPAITHVAHSSYEPPVKNGKPVYVEATVKLQFRDPQAPAPTAKKGN